MPMSQLMPGAAMNFQTTSVTPIQRLTTTCATLVMLLAANLLHADALFKACDSTPGKPEPIIKPMPVYPIEALKHGKQGWVKVRFTVLKDGRVTKPEVAKSFPDNTFDRAAIIAAKGFRYEPARKDGIPIATPNVTNRITFKIIDHPKRIKNAVMKVRGLLSKQAYGDASTFLDGEIKRQGSADPLSAYLGTLRYLKGVTLAVTGDSDGAFAIFKSLADQCKTLCPLAEGLTSPLYIQTGNIYASHAQWQQSEDYYTRALSPYERAQRTADPRAKRNKPDHIVINTYANYAVAAMNLGDWCAAKHGFASAISDAKAQSMDYPKMWQKGLELSEQQLTSKAQVSHSP